MGRLYDALLAGCDHPDDPATLRGLNVLCVRLVFCLYADDAGVFDGPKGRRRMFRAFVTGFRPEQLTDNLALLFDTLATPPDGRRTKNPDLRAFPYIDGGLFSGDDDVELPVITREAADLLAGEAGAFNWREISPAIFGAVFESTLNPETRRRGGMHYTSAENIHKVIDPLFLDDLRAELAEIKETAARPALARRLKAFIRRLSKLVFLDPACGSGNFLTESYVCLRRLENEALELLHRGKKQLVLPILVGIGQFHGIEINGFAVAVARTALWIAESQMHAETADFCHPEQDLLPLRSHPGVVEGNALRMDWDEIAGPEGADYIMGNPPFVGARVKSAAQREDILSVFGPGWPNVGDLDYVSCWFKKAADVMRGRRRVRTAFVATNSVCQGEGVPALWKPLMLDGVRIDFARRSFRWRSETRGMAHVHCVVVGFSRTNTEGRRIIYDGGQNIAETNINGYLIDAGNVFVEGRSRPICDAPQIFMGNQPLDNGSYLFTDAGKAEFVRKEKKSEKYFRLWYGAKEFLHNRPRHCLWLRNCPPEELRGMPRCRERIQAVRDFRLSCRRASTRRSAETPLLFQAEIFPDREHVVIPKTSSENRRYIPIGFLPGGVLCSDLLFIIPDATLHHFGILTSSAHNAWTRTVGGRLEMSCRYSKEHVYNSFPWPEASEGERERIAALAQGVLDARAAHPDDSLAALYDPLLMPQDLRRAHAALDRAVLALYGLKAAASEMEIVAALLERHAALTAEENLPCAEAPPKDGD